MTGWKSEAGYSDDTALVKLYPPTDHKEAWRREAEQRGTSMSQYCQELIQEARFLREQGQLQIGDRRQVEKLQDELEKLEKQVENQSRTSVELRGIVDDELVETVLSTNYQPLDDLVDQLVVHPEFRQRVRKELEVLLYELGNRGETAFRRGWGWKYIEGGDG